METVEVWGSGSFENEAAMRWVERLEDADDLQLVEETLEEVLEVDQDGEVPDSLTAAQAIAAAETVAALRSRPAETLPEEIRQWCFDNPALDLEEAQPKAVQALGVILEMSGLRQLHEGTGAIADWELAVEALRERLAME